MNRHYLNKPGFYKLAQSVKDYINRKITGYAKLGTASTKDFTTYVSPTQTEQLPISSSVYSAMTNMLRGAYHPAGSKTIAELTSDLLVKANLGNVYKITEDGITSDLFIGGAGQTIKTGDNAIVLYASEDTYRFSLESGVVDLDAYQKKELAQALTIADSQRTTVEQALIGLSEIVPSNARASNLLVTENSIVHKIPFDATSGMIGYYTQNNEIVHVHIVAYKSTNWGDWQPLAPAKAVPSPSSAITNIVTKGSKNPTTGNPIGLYIFQTGAISEAGGGGLAAGYYIWDFVYSTNSGELIANNGLQFITAADLTSSVTSGSTVPITSGGVYTEFSRRMSRAVINTSTDLNTFTTVEGVYYFSGGVTMPNAPVTQPFGILEVIKVGTGVTVQRYWDFIAGDMWLRRNTAKVFTAWVKFTHTA